MILIIIIKIYPAVEPEALVDIVHVGVVAPLDAVHKGSSADQRRREEDDPRITRKERTKRVVVPLAQQRFGGLLFRYSCTQELEWESLCHVHIPANHIS
jgi:hypothetical protein